MTEPRGTITAETEEWITTAEAADMLNVTQRWITDLAVQGKIKGQKINPKLWLVTRESVKEYAKTR